MQGQEDKKLEKFNISVNKITLGGFIVVCLIILQVFGTTTPDVAIYISLGSVAIAIPLLASYFMLLILQENEIIKGRDWTVGRFIGYVIEVIGMVGTIVALNAALWHVRWFIGVMFLVSVLVAALYFLSYILRQSDYDFGHV